MKCLRIFLLIYILCSLSLVGLIYADIPKVINYQGRFTDKDDNPLSGNFLVTFRFYDVESGGQSLWEESHILSIKNGLFNALLGSIKPLDLDFNKDLWLGVEVASDGEMSPRIKLTSAPYAMNAQTIDMLDSSQLIRSDIDSVMSGSLTLKRDLVLRGDARSPSRIVLTNGQGREYYLWMDNNGDLRIKEGLPEFDKDGYVFVKEKQDLLSRIFVKRMSFIILLIVALILGLILYSSKKR